MTSRSSNRVVKKGYLKQQEEGMMMVTVGKDRHATAVPVRAQQEVSRGSASQTRRGERTQSRRLTWITMSLTALKTNLIWFVCESSRRNQLVLGDASTSLDKTHVGSAGEVSVDLLGRGLVETNESTAEVVASSLEVGSTVVVGEEVGDW